MPDVTISFTDAQWARIVAASSRIKDIRETGNVDADYLSAMLKARVSKLVTQYEQSNAHNTADASLDDF